MIMPKRIDAEERIPVAKLLFLVFHQWFSKPMIATMQEDLHIIEIKEGRGDRKRALEYLKASVSHPCFTVSALISALHIFPVK